MQSAAFAPSLTSFVHDLLCFDQSCLDGTGQLQQCNDYTLELLYAKNQSLPPSCSSPSLLLVNSPSVSSSITS